VTKVHCHLCGAALRRPDQFYEVVHPDRDDVIYVCRDEKRCSTRAVFDPPTGRSVPTRTEAPR
jgi:hypothetical protein